MQWYELTENPRLIVELYHEVPSLQSLDLIEVVLHVEQTKMILRADLSRFPDIPPTRWRELKYDTLQIRLEFWKLQSLKITQWSTENLVDAQIEKISEEQISLKIVSPQCDIQAVAHSLRIGSVGAYQQGVF